MENIKQQTADQFWKTHFADLLEHQLNEQHAHDINFWDKFQQALEASDRDTVHAIIYSQPAMTIATGEIYLRIVKTAKHIWDTKRT